MNRLFTKEFWLERDKQLHFGLMALFGIVGTFISMILCVVYKESAYLAISSTFCVGVLVIWFKELLDGTGRGTKDIHDVDAGMLGLVVGIVLALMTYYFKDFLIWC